MSIVENIHWTKFEKHGLLEKITISQLREFADQFLTEMKILAVMQGNIMKEDAVAVMKNVLNNIPCHKVNDVSIFLCLDEMGEETFSKTSRLKNLKLSETCDESKDSFPS